MAFNEITRGLIKALGLIANRNTINQNKRSTRYTFEPAGTAIHATRMLTATESKNLDVLADRLKEADTDDAKKEILAQISAYPVRFVPVKRAHLNVRGKTYSGIGAKEKARAARRAAPSLQAAA